VSVVIPTRDRAALVAEAVCSVIAQTFVDWELVVVDDGSRDDTASQLEGLDPRLRVVAGDGRGPAAARNLGLDQARGELIAFLDSDDLARPHHLADLTAVLADQPECDVAYGWHYWLDASGKPTELGAPTLHGDALAGLLGGEAMLMGTHLVRVEAARSVGGFDETLDYMEHWDFFLRLAEAGHRFAYASRPVAWLREHAGSRGRDAAGMHRAHLEVLRRALARPRAAALPRAVREQARARVWLTLRARARAGGDLTLAGRCLGEALAAGPLPWATAERLAGDLRREAMREPRPRGYLRRAFGAAAASPALTTLSRQVEAEVCTRLALAARQRGRRRARLAGVFGALRRDPGSWRDAGLRHALRPRRAGRGSRTVLAAEAASIFLSPHPDDAVFSCGGALAELARRRAPLVMATVFAGQPAPDAPLSPLAARLHEAWAGDYAVRRGEDAHVAAALGARLELWDFHEALYREPGVEDASALRDPGGPAPSPLFEAVRARVRALLAQHPGATVFAPLAVGDHRDHVLLHAVVRALEGQLPGQRVYYYEDFPYAQEARVEAVARARGLDVCERVDIRRTLEARVQLTGCYVSQLSSTFVRPGELHELIRRHACALGGGVPTERYWRAAEGARILDPSQSRAHAS
jgi:LmbE family N-acetylglucosaminyl deacetylase/GT2 family glycosyltransferase